MVDDQESRLDLTAEQLEKQGGLVGLLVALLGGTYVTIAFNLWDMIDSLGETIMRPLRAFAGALATLIRGSIGGPVVMLEAAVQTGAASVTEGLFSTFGLFAYPVTMISVMAGIYVFAWFWQRIDLSPWGFLRRLR